MMTLDTETGAARQELNWKKQLFWAYCPGVSHDSCSTVRFSVKSSQTRSFVCLGFLTVGFAVWLWLAGKPTASKPPLQSGPVAETNSQPESPRLPSSPPISRVAKSAFEAFDAWTARFITSAEVAEKQKLLDEGIALASARRTALKSLIATNPREALERAVPPVVRQQLPRAVFERLEERVNESAFYGVLGALPGAGSEVGPAIRRHVRTDDGGSYRAFVFGARNTQQTTERASIVGIAVDDFLAVDESPLRVVAAGEIPNHLANLSQRRTVTLRDDAGFSTAKTLRENGSLKPLVDVCPVSGNETELPEASAPISAAQPVVEAEGKFQFLCSGGHVHAYREALVAREGANGGPAKPTNLPSATQATGYKSHLLMRVAFPETRRESVTEKEGYKLGQDVEDWFVDASFGKLSFMTTVTPLLILPRTEAWYKDADTSGSAYEVLSDARAAAKAAGFSPSNFDFDTVIYAGTPGSFGGQAYVGGKGCWLKSGTGVGVACHEYGHNFGLWHANYWNTSGASVIGAGSHVEYGDSFDTMGSASAGDLQFNACHKNLLGWIPNALVHSVTSGGTYRIYQMDQPRQDPSLRYALKVRKDSDRDYWVDLRQRSFSANRWVANGVFLHWSPWTASEGGSHLLDATPGSPDDKTDSPLVIGRTFSDRESGIHITPLAKNATVPPSFDVAVNIGDFPANQAPTLTIAADQTVVNTATAVAFSATAADVDGDALSYWWDFGDKNFATTNSPTVTKSWANAGMYVVRCVVSDMKGGTASQAVAIRVGTVTDFAVSGTVRLNGLPMPDVRIHNGLTGGAYRGAFTNSDGTFIVSGLAAGSYTIGAASHGYTLTPVTAATVTVGPDAANIDFTAAETTRVSITAVAPAIAEGASGTLRFTRTGATTSALTVNVAYPGGFAFKGSDYTLTPDFTYSDPYYRVTIPAGQTVLNVAFAATQDSAQEGPETAVFELLPGTGYTISQSTATITITDDDTTKPLVRLFTKDGDASEDGGTGEFIIERLGSTSGALNVALAIGGTATNGTDFAAIATSVTIADGQSQASVGVAPIADTTNEGTETVTLSVATSSAYVPASSSNDYTGTVNITDSGLPTVSIVASDPNAAEAGNDPGVFVVTRTGSTAQPLTVQLGLTGSALQGVDYVSIPAQVTFPVGSEVATIVVTPIDDGIGEPAQTVRLYLRTSGTYIVGTPADATVSIADNSDVPYVTVGTSASAKESGTNGSFKITTQGTGSGNITVRYTISGTAMSGADFTALPGTLSIGKNTTATITVVPIQDTENEGYETLTLTLDADPAYTVALDRAATLLIEDDELPQVSVSTTDDYFGEYAGATAKFFVSRTGATTSALTVNYTISGTATAGADYTAPSGTVTIPPAKAGTYVDIAILEDSAKEGTETITLNITPDAAYSAGFSSATHYLDDGDTPTRTLRFLPASATVSEADGTATATISLSAAATTTVTVDVVIDGGTALGGGIDHSFAPTTVTFAPGETSKSVSIPITDDTLTEGNETVIIALDNPLDAALSTSGDALFTLTLTDNDSLPPATVGFTNTTSTAVETAGTAPLYITLSGAAASVVTVDYAVTGGTATAADHTIVAGTLTFAAGETVKLLPNTIINDSAQELSETLIVTLSNPAGISLSANAAHTLTILDDDTMTLSIAATAAAAAEPAAHGLFTITRTGATVLEVPVNLVISGTATPGADYAAIPATATLPAGATTVSIPISVIDDLVGETSETVIATLAAGGYTIGAPSSATVTISDDEPAVSIVASDASSAEIDGDAGTIVITRTGSTAAPLTLDATISGTATADSDYAALPTPITIPAGSAALTLTVSPVNDVTPEGSETVVVTLNTVPGYFVSGPSTATVTILDDDVNAAPNVVIESPGATSVTLPAGVGLVLDSTVTDDAKPYGSTVTTTWSKVSGPGAVTFENPAQQDTAVSFGSPGSYILRLSASDSELTANRDILVAVLDTNQPWTGTNIAAATPAGSFIEDAGTITVLGGGSNISASSDTFFFVNRPLIGNFDMRARIVSMTGGGASAKAGVMIRQTTSGSSRGAFMSAYNSGSSATSWRTRTTDGGTAASTNGTGTPSFPRWVRMVRNGASYTGFTSTNGSAWTAVGTAGTVTMTEPMLIGLAVTSNNTAALTTAVFDSISITPVGSFAPFVTAGIAGSTFLSQPAALDGSASDDGLPGALSTTWSKRSGPGTVTFADSAATTTTAQFSAPGTYVLRLIADDSQVKTFDDTTIVVTSPEVNITANSPTATEANSGVASFTFTRSGSGDSAIALQFTTGGTATGTDYSDASAFLSDGVVSMPIGTTTAVVTAPIVKDALVEGTETLVLSINGADGYALGASHSATVSIIDAPVLSLAASAINASEFGPASGAFTITRTGNLSAPLSFATATSGTATPGADYTANPPILTFPPGAASLSVPVQPLADNIAEGTESATLTLVESPEFAMSTSTATIQIADLPADNWRFSSFAADAGNPAISGDLADPDGDGIVNLLEYAFALEPHGASAAPSVALENSELTLTYRRNLLAPDLSYVVEESSTPDDWHAASPTEEIISDDGAVRVIRAKVSATGSSSKFLRLKVSRP